MNWYNRQLKIARTEARVLSEDDIKTIIKMVEEGYAFKDISSLLDFNPNVLRSVLKRYGIDIKEVFEQKREEKKNRIKELYESGKTVMEIAREVGLNHASVIDNLKALGIHKRKNKEPLPFNLTIKDIEKIDKLYREGHSILGISKILGVSRNQLEAWFDDTGRKRRSRQEQSDTQYSRNLTSVKMKQFWKEIGGLKGYLESCRSRNEAIDYLNKFISAKIKQYGRTQFTYQTYNKYMEIIENHTFSDEVQQVTPV